MRTSEIQTSLFTGTGSTSSPEGSPASHTAPQENDLEKKMTATSGRKCLEQFGRFPRAGAWAKTFAALLIGMEGWYSTRCRLIWNLRGTKSSRFYFQLVPSTHPTDVTGYGLWPTPTSVQRDHPERVEKLKATGAKTMTSRAAGENRPNSILDAAMFYGMLPTPTAQDLKRLGPNSKQQGLPETAHKGMLPTPQSRDWRSPDKPDSRNMKRKLQKGWTIDLNSLAPLLPTPTASSDAKGGCQRKDAKRQNDTLAHAIHGMQGEPGKTSQLNPRFVAEMMGFPPNWTELPFQNGETRASKVMEMQLSPR